ncbi:hypothetical protein B0H13DRAFT_2374493 [Mycena leptocephala]|nr:hypothetical protein B0H13DRAFT_2374493 [Mycena leptocephala]
MSFLREYRDLPSALHYLPLLPAFPHAPALLTASPTSNPPHQRPPSPPRPAPSVSRSRVSPSPSALVAVPCTVTLGYMYQSPQRKGPRIQRLSGIRARDGLQGAE